MTASQDGSSTSAGGPVGRCRVGSSVARRLESSGYLALRRLECECAEGGVVFLRGRVPSHYLKQVAQAIAAEVDGVRRIENQLRVGAAGRPDGIPEGPPPA